MKHLCFFIFLFFSFGIYAQCPTEEFTNQAIKSLRSDLTHTLPIYIASKKEAKDTKRDFEITLTKGITYEFTIYDGPDHPEQLVISLFDIKNNCLACSYIESSKKKMKTIRFICKSTGQYSLSYYPDKKTYCGLILVSAVNLKK